MPDIVSAAPNLGFTALLAGAVFSEFDVALLCADLKAYPAQTTNGAAKPNYGDNVIAPTSISSATGTLQAQAFTPAPIIQDAVTNEIFFAHSDQSASRTGVRLDRYDAAGNLIKSVVVDATGHEPGAVQLFELANGSLEVVYNDGASPPNLRFAIYDRFLTQIKAPTTVATTIDSQLQYAIPLATSGSMMTWCESATPEQVWLATFDNTGSVVTAAFDLKTFSGTGGPVIPKLHTLSDGNVAFVACSAFTTSIGLWTGVLGQDGSIQHAITNQDATFTNGSTFVVDHLAGYFAVGKCDQTNAKCFVFSNANAAQGTAFSAATTSVVEAITDDGTQFYFSFEASAGTSINFVVVPISGSNYVTTNAGTLAAAPAAACRPSMKWERDRLILAVPDNETWKFGVYNTINRAMEHDFATTGITASIGPGTSNMFLSGDFTMLLGLMYDQGSATGAVSFLEKKYLDASVQGVALCAAAQGADVNQSPKPNAYKTNPLKGPPSVAISQSAANVPGRVGLIGNNGLIITA